jgi:hypothetical protein
MPRRHRGQLEGRLGRVAARGDHPTGAQVVRAITLTATRNAQPSPPTVFPPPRTVMEVATQQPATAVNATPHQQANFLAAETISATSAEPTEPPNTLRAVVLAALATAGLGAPNGPLTPVDSPLELAMLAVGARRRPVGQLTIEETARSTRTGQGVDGEQTLAAAAITAAAELGTECSWCCLAPTLAAR